MGFTFFGDTDTLCTEIICLRNCILSKNKVYFLQFRYSFDLDDS